MILFLAPLMLNHTLLFTPLNLTKIEESRIKAVSAFVMNTCYVFSLGTQLSTFL